VIGVTPACRPGRKTLTASAAVLSAGEEAGEIALDARRELRRDLCLLGTPHALELAKHGTLVLVGRSPTSSAEVKRELDQRGDSAVCVVV